MRYNLELLENTSVCVILLWSPRPGSNWLPPPYQGDALPTELHGQDYKICFGISRYYYGIIMLMPHFVKMPSLAFQLNNT